MSDAVRAGSLVGRLAPGRVGRLGSSPRRGGRLFRKYVLLLVALVGFVLLVTAVFSAKRRARRRGASRTLSTASRSRSAGRPMRNGRRARSTSAASISLAYCARCRRSPKSHNSTARDGQILISQRIAAAVENSVALEEVGSLTLKGLSRPVAVYNIVGEIAPYPGPLPATRGEGGPAAKPREDERRKGVGYLWPVHRPLRAQADARAQVAVGQIDRVGDVRAGRLHA